MAQGWEMTGVDHNVNMVMTAFASALWEKGTDRLYGWLCWDSGSKAFRDG